MLCDGAGGGAHSLSGRIALCRVGHPSAEQRIVQHDCPAVAQQSHRLGDILRVLQRRRVDEDQIVGAVGQARQNVERASVDQPGPCGWDLGGAERLLAARWCSGSESMVVSVPSSRIPSSSHSPLMPAPVPTSTTARAPSNCA